MATASPATILRFLHDLSSTGVEPRLADGELLHRFIARHDQAAFAVLVGRHGPLVWRVCRAVLRHDQDAEDAFQATFVVLARKASSLRNPQALAAWLHGVASQVARRARRDAARRQAREQKARDLPPPSPVAEGAWRQLQAALDEEVQHLPEKLRVPFVLCFLQGRCQADVARALGCRPGTVSARLSQARQELLGRLAQRGVSLSAALTAVVLSGDAARAAVPSALASTTVQAVAACTAARGCLAGVTSTRVAALARGGVPSMFLSRGKGIAVLLVCAGLLAATAGVLVPRSAVGRERESLSAATQAPGKSDKGQPGQPEGPQQPGERVEVRGRVLGPDGKACAGARLLFVPSGAGEGNKAGPAVETTSGADGRFRLMTARKGLVRGRQLVAVAEGHGPDWVEADRLTGGEVIFRLVRDVTISGRVRDLEGRPVKDVVVHVRDLQATAGDDLSPVLAAWNPDGNRLSDLLTRYLHQASAVIKGARTDAAGRFRLSGVGRDRVVSLRVEGPTIDHRVLYVLCRPDLDVKTLPLPQPRPGLGRPTLPALYGLSFEHIARPTRPVAGKVVDRATGKALAGIHVFGRGAGAWWGDEARTVTDAQGHFRLVGMPKGSRYSVRAAGVARGYLPAEKGLADSAGLAPLSLDFELMRGVRVRGRVTDRTTGKPVFAALFYSPLVDNKYFKDVPGNDFYRYSSIGGRTKKDGSFDLLALPGAGLLRFRAEVDGLNPYTQVALAAADRKRAYRENDPGMGPCFLSVGSGIETLLGHNAYRLIDPELGVDALTCDVQFDRGRALAIHVVGPDARPLAGATASGVTALGGISVVKGNTFTALGLSPEWPRTVTCIHAGRKLAGHIRLTEKDAGPLTIALRPWATVTGRLLDEDGKAMPDVQVRLFYAADSARGLFESGIPASTKAVKTDARGAFKVEGVFPDMPFGLVFVKGGRFRDVGQSYQKLSLTPGQTSALGDIPSRPYR
jgi:RNA polymerase sigma factor (sigma-70 family)